MYTKKYGLVKITCMEFLMAYNIHITVFIFGMMVLYTEAVTCPDETQFYDGSRCCTKCKAGYGLVSSCSNDSDTACESCISGKTYSSNEVHSNICKPCTVCKTHFHTLTPCNVSHDTVCECDAYFYFSHIESQCQLCTMCNVGWGAEIQCNSRQNSVCKPCGNSTYSDTKSATSPCLPCTKCKRSQILLRHCTATEDTLCIDIPVTMTTKANIFKNYNVVAETEDRGFDIIPLYCAILGAVVVGLLGYVLFKNYTRIRAKQRHKGHDPHEDVEYSKASGGDSGVYVENEAQTKTYNQLTKVKDLPPNKRKEIEKYLATKRINGDDWRALAQELGYNCRKIESFSSRSPDPAVQSKTFISDWVKKKHATVGVLITALINIGRPDIVKIIQCDLTNVKNVDENGHHVV